MATPTTALLMRSDAIACRVTAERLRRLGLVVTEFADEPHLYAHAISLVRGMERNPFVILAEPTGPMVRDLEVLRAGWRAMPMVLVGRGASPETARLLRAACVSRAQPTMKELRDAIDAAMVA
jgi:hypothetical protein